MPDTRYAYAVSRVKALETRLIERATVDRLLGEDPAGLLRWARESEYADGFRDITAVREFPIGLRRHLAHVLDTLEGIVPEPKVIQAFRLRYDYHNLKVLFKARALDRDATMALSDLGTVASDRLAQWLKEEAWAWLPPPMRDAWRSADASLSRGESLRIVSAGFDNARWQHRLAMAEDIAQPDLARTFREAITMHNIITFIRVKDGAAERDDIDALLLDGSILDRAFFRRHYDEPVQLFLDSLGRTEYARHILTRATAAIGEERAYWSLDVARDNYFVKRVWEDSANPFSAAPVLHYLIRKKAEGKLLYAIWLAAKAGWDRTTMRDRLRSAYA